MSKTADVRRVGRVVRRVVIAWLGSFGLWVALAVAPAAAQPPAEPAAPPTADPWSEDVSWISVRAGSASSGARFTPEGGFGYGFGFSWFLANQLAWSATVQHDILGHYGRAAEMEIPITVEFTRHFRFSSTSRPYLGLGWGAIFHKTYRTSADDSGFRQAIYLALGGNSMLNAGNLLGLDVRLTMEQDTRSINPTFPNLSASTTNWSVKLSYSRVL